MINSIRFFPECHIDTALMRTLLYDKQKLIIHIKGTSKMGGTLAEQARIHGNSRVVIAMVDNDKRLFSITKLSPFSQLVLKCNELECLFEVYRHQELSNHYLIVLNPACDGWIYGNMRAAGLNPQEYGVPAEFKEFLKRFTKKKQSEERPEVVSLLKALRTSAPPAYAQLSSFVMERLREAGEAAE